MKNPFAGLTDKVLSLVNRSTTVPQTQSGRESINGIAQSASANPADRIGDPLSGLSPTTIDFIWRQQINRGEYTYPTWALYNAAQLISAIGDKFSFWSASLSGLDYDILLSDEIQNNPALKARAKAQQQALKKAYSAHNMATVFKHLALAKFYGYSVLSRKTPMEPLDWWNVLRDGLHGAFYWNPECRQTTTKAMQPANIMSPDKFIIRECQDALILKCLRSYKRIFDVETWWDKNLEQESRRQVIVLTGTPDKAKTTQYEAAARNIAEGRSGYISKGPADSPTEIVFPPASRGLQFYENRLRIEDEGLTKSLTGSLLTMLTAPGSGTLAGNAHESTLSTVITAEAGEISEVLQEQFDRPELEAAGLLSPGEQPLAYFAMRTSKANDPANEALWTSQLAVAGWKRTDAAVLSERMGMELVPISSQITTGQDASYIAPTTPSTPADNKPGASPTIPVDNVDASALNGAQISSLVYVLSQAAAGMIPLASVKPIVKAAFPSIADETIDAITGPLSGFIQTKETPVPQAIPNRKPGNDMAKAIGVPPEWIDPVRGVLSELEKKVADESLTDEQLQTEFQKIIDSLPEVFEKMDHAKLAETMLEVMKESGKGGLENAFDPDQARDKNGEWSETGDSGMKWKTKD